MAMKHFALNSEKNAQLIEDRGISFERVVYHIERDEILDVIKHLIRLNTQINGCLS
jgi:predicted membrane GTPase involved in stress response